MEKIHGDLRGGCWEWAAYDKPTWVEYCLRDTYCRLICDFSRRMFDKNIHVMKPNRSGQIVRFHTPFEDEDPNQLYVILEYIEDGKRTRAKIMALDTGLGFPPVSMVYVRDLEVDIHQTKALDEVLRRGLF